MWLYALAGVFVLAIMLWAILIVHGLKHLILRLSDNSKYLEVKGRASINDNTTNTSNVFTDGADRSKWGRISPRKPIQRNSSENMKAN